MYVVQWYTRSWMQYGVAIPTALLHHMKTLPKIRRQIMKPLLSQCNRMPYSSHVYVTCELRLTLWHLDQTTECTLPIACFGRGHLGSPPSPPGFIWELFCHSQNRLSPNDSPTDLLDEARRGSWLWVNFGTALSLLSLPLAGLQVCNPKPRRIQSLSEQIGLGLGKQIIGRGARDENVRTTRTFSQQMHKWRDGKRMILPNNVGDFCLISPRNAWFSSTHCTSWDPSTHLYFASTYGMCCCVTQTYASRSPTKLRAPHCKRACAPSPACNVNKAVATTLIGWPVMSMWRPSGHTYRNKTSCDKALCVTCTCQKVHSPKRLP